MANILPRDLPPAGTVPSGSAIIIDNGVGVEKATPLQLVDSARPQASQTDALAGTDNTKSMTPLRVREAIMALSPLVSGNVAETLADLKAYAVEKGTALAAFSGGTPFTWTPGDFSALEDDVNYVASDTTPISEGAWARQFSDAVAFLQGGAGSSVRTVQDKLSERISSLDYGAVCDGVTDDSAAHLAAINDNKGKTIVLVPQGRTSLAAGINLSGSTYNGTSLVIEGKLLMKPSGGVPNWDPGVSPSYNAIMLHDCEDITVDVPGVIDGNRTAQTAWQQHHCLQLRGARRVRIPRFNAVEVRGDGIVMTTKTNTPPFTTNTSDVVIGLMSVINNADDGRNALSIVSGENITVAGGISILMGGTINGERMPGGFDIEPNSGSEGLVKNVRSGPWVVQMGTGTSGIACIGHAITDDATRDWNVQDVWIAPSTVTVTGPGISGPIFKRNMRVTADVTLIRTGGRSPGISIDYQDFSTYRCRAKGVSIGVTVGTEDFANDCDINVEIEDHSAAGLLVIGANRSRFTGSVRGGQGAGSYGVQLSVGSRGSVTQSANTFSVSVPYDANNTFGFTTSAGLTFSNGTCVANCAFNGYPGFATMFGMGSFIRTRNVTGRNNGTAMPATGTWMVGDFVINDNPVIATGKVLTGWSRLVSGTAHVAGTDWTPIYGTTT